jgi:hypothetical protein
VWSAALPLSYRDLDVHGGHTDEIHLGYSRQLPGNVLLDAGWTHKKSSDALTTYDANLKIVDNKWAGVKNPAYSTLAIPTNNTWSWTVYDAVETGLSRNFGGKLQMIATYTYANMRNKGGFQPGTKEYYYYSNMPENWYESSTGRPHIFRMNGSFLLPRKVSVTAIFSFQSGKAMIPTR